MNGVLVAVRAELLQFQAPRRVAAVFHRRVARDTGRALVWVGATLGTLESNNDPYPFLGCHSRFSRNSNGRLKFNTNNHYFIRRVN